MTLDEPAAARGFQYKHGERPLEGYTIQRAAGRGGFGEVYYAVSDSGREVALKLVHTYEQIELRGISQCMNLKNPHLVTIFDVKYGEDGRPWVIMEYVAGPSLRELLDASPSGLGVAKAAFFLREIGKGLSYLHDCGIVHRDLKPGNIFYENGYVKIGDYGLSKTMSMTRHSGQTVAVGTLHYMAPEIGDGHYDRSIDIYAMGAMLFEMLTGQVPFYGSSPAEVLMKHLSSNVNLDGVDEPLKSVIRKAMAKNPAERYQSVQEMVEAVFGSEEIRNSVSHFSPASLTMVAGRVAGGVGAGSGGRPGSAPPGGSSNRRSWDGWRGTGRQWDRNGDPWARFAVAAENIGNHVGRQFADAGERLNECMQRKFNRKWRYWGQPPAAPAGNFFPGADPLSLTARIFLALAAAAVAVIVGMSNVSARSAPQQGAFIFFSIVGAVIAAKLAWRFIAAGLAGESHWFRRFAIGAPVGFGAMIVSFPTWIATTAPRHREAVMATFLSLMLLDWPRRLSPERKERFNLGHVITAAICAAILSAMCEDEPDITVVAAVAGASLAISLCSARRSLVGPIPPGAAAPIITPPPVGAVPSDQDRWASPPPVPPVYPPPPAPPFPSSAPTDPQYANRRSDEPSAPAIVALAMCVPLAFFAAIFHIAIFPIVLPFVIAAIVFHFTRGGRMASMTVPIGSFANSGLTSEVGGFFSGIARGILSLVGSLLLLAALLLTLGAATNLPGLFTSGVLDARMPHDLQYALGPEPDRILREIGSALAFVLTVFSIAMLLAARRRGGGAHMIRVIVGAAILFGAVLSLSKALPDWADFVVLTTPGATIDWYLSRVDMHRAVPAAVIGAVGWTILCWPRKTRPMFNPAFSGVQSNAQASNPPGNPGGAGGNPG